MRAIRFPGREDAIRRLCLTEPALCADAAAGRAQFPAGWVLLWLLLVLGLFATPAKAQVARGAAAAGAARVSAPSIESARAAESVASVGMTVSDMDRAVEFYTRVLAFEKVSDEEEVAGESYEQLEGVF